MNVEAVRAGLAANIQTLITDAQVSAYILSNPSPPAVIIMPGPADHNAVFQRGHEQRDFTVQVLIGLQSDIGAQKRLDTYLSEDSVTQAILSDPTLGGKVDDINVERDSGYQQFLREAQPPILGAEWTVRVYG